MAFRDTSQLCHIEVSKMLKDKSGAEPSNTEVSATRLSAMTYCQTVGKARRQNLSGTPYG